MQWVNNTFRFHLSSRNDLETSSESEESNETYVILEDRISDSDESQLDECIIKTLWSKLFVAEYEAIIQGCNNTKYAHHIISFL